MKPHPLPSTALAFLRISALTFPASFSLAQSLTSGDVAGTVVDPSGAAVPNATVTLQSKENGSTRTATTSGTGAYRFSLLNPGDYTVSASSQVFRRLPNTMCRSL